jgi:hypothetical protein
MKNHKNSIWNRDACFVIDILISNYASHFVCGYKKLFNFQSENDFFKIALKSVWNEIKRNSKKPQIGREKKFRSLKINLCLFMLCEHIASGFSIIHISLRCTALMKFLLSAMSMWRCLRLEWKYFINFINLFLFFKDFLKFCFKILKI